MRPDPALLPMFAPLSEAVIVHLANITGPSSLQELYSKFLPLRLAAYTKLHSLAVADALTTGGLVELLRAAGSPRLLTRNGRTYTASHTKATIDTWRDRNLLLMRAWGRPDPQSSAAILIARLMAPERAAAWLPSYVEPRAPQWWCWRQDALDQTAQPCPVPLTGNLPAATLVWTPWRGAAWDAGWIDIGFGAARWGGAPAMRDLLAWDPQIATTLAALGLAADQLVPELIASHLLLRLATQRLKRMQPPELGRSDALNGILLGAEREQLPSQRRQLDIAWRRPFLLAIRQGFSDTQACQHAGISRMTAHRHRQHDPQFAEAWRRARADRQAAPAI